ncbi:MAG: TIGR02679 domain-containing protein, partial [Thermoleophilaceae bacterium]
MTRSGSTAPDRAAEAAARSYLGQPGLRRPLALARERMERLGRTGGTVELAALSDEEASALGGLLGLLRRSRRPRAREPFRLGLADLDSALRRSRFALPLERALALLGPPLDPLAARRERDRDARAVLWDEA